MTGMMSKIKGKLMAGWGGLFSPAPAAQPNASTFSAKTLYYIFYPRGPVAADAIGKDSLLEGTHRIEKLLAAYKDDSSPDHLLFLMAFREFQGVVHKSNSETEFTFEDKLLIPLYDHAMVIAQTIDALAARQQAIKGQGGIAALQGKTEIKALQTDIDRLAHVNNRIGTLFTPGHIADKAQQQKRDMQREYANHSPFLPKEWRIG